MREVCGCCEAGGWEIFGVAIGALMAARRCPVEGSPAEIFTGRVLRGDLERMPALTCGCPAWGFPQRHRLSGWLSGVGEGDSVR